MLLQIQAELKKAMFEKNTLHIQVLRMLLSALKNESIAKGLGPQGELGPSDCIAVVKRLVKSRQDSIEQFRSVGQGERADEEQREVDLLQVYLPKQLTESELRQAIQEAIKATQAQQIKDLGKVMKFLQSAHAGNYDGKLASTLVSQFLTS
ncbi:MAG: GatB/YqeY domain-containing protein [Holophagaceae bacterium]|jgi:uncharacterized protein YqeY